MANEQVSSTKFKITATIGDVVFRDAVAAIATFPLKGIPYCSLTVAVGRDSDDKQATIHQTIAALQPRAVATIHIEAMDHGSVGLKDPLNGKSGTIFEGFYVGPSWTRNGNTAAFELHFVHWLDDLNTTAILNSNFHPGSAYNASIGAVVPTGSGGAGTAWAPILPSFHNQIDGLLQADTWKQVILPWMEFLAESNKLDTETSLLKLKAGRAGNDSALAVLKRMSGGAHYVPLAMRMYDDTGTIAQCIASYLVQPIIEPWVTSTLWGKLIGDWGAQLMFSICPRIKDAIAIPFAGPMRESFKTIRANEYSHLGRVADQSQVILGIGILHGSTSSSGGDAQAGSIDANPQFLSNLAGWYPPSPPPGAKERGVIMMKRPPVWLTSNVEQTKFAVTTTGADETVIGTAASPGKGTAPSGLSPAAAMAKTGSFLDEYARHWYALESLQSRTCELAGKLRFDIAPGSQIRIETRGELFSGDNIVLHGTVMQVSFVVDSERPHASTSFSLAYIRPEAENDANYVLDQPPIYSQPWLGAPLSDELG